MLTIALIVFVMVTPSSLASATCSISSPKSVIFIWPCFLPFLFNIISCVFLGFNFILHFEHHASRSFNVFDILYVHILYFDQMSTCLSRLRIVKSLIGY